MSYETHMNTIADHARKIVTAAIAAVNEDLPAPRQIEVNDAAPLVGTGGGLDSLRLINLVVHVEDSIERDLGLEVSLTDSPDLFDDSGPLSTTGGFIDHVAALIDAGAA